MQPKVFLRAAAIVALLLAIGHTLGRPWTPVKTPDVAAVVEAMRSHPVQVAGVERTLLDFYVGFGLTLSVYLFMQAVLLWVLAALAVREPVGVRALVAVFLAADLAVAALAGIYLFIVPVVFSGTVALLLAIAMCLLRGPLHRDWGAAPHQSG
jgi:hypothetical protein